MDKWRLDVSSFLVRQCYRQFSRPIGGITLPRVTADRPTCSLLAAHLPELGEQRVVLKIKLFDEA